MPVERYFIDQSIKVHDQKELKGNEFHHLAHVMRAQKGETVELVNGKGALAQATVQNISKDKTLLKIEHVEQEAQHSTRLILAQAIPKANRLDFILEKGTELGVDCFWLFPGHGSVKKEFLSHQLERAKTITIAAMKQSGRLFLPDIIVKPKINDWPVLNEMSSFYGDLESDAAPFEVVWKGEKSAIYPVLFVIGPEKGFSEGEVQLLKDRGAKGVKLHPNILRTDTAAILAIGLLSHWLFTKS